MSACLYNSCGLISSITCGVYRRGTAVRPAFGFDDEDADDAGDNGYKSHVYVV